jgi:hypothetical protein
MGAFEWACLITFVLGMTGAFFAARLDRTLLAALRRHQRQPNGRLKMDWRVGLGDQIRDQISGLRGVCTARIEYLYGCQQVSLSPNEHKDGKVADSSWLDESRVEIVADSARVVPVGVTDGRDGGPSSGLTPPRTV